MRFLQHWRQLKKFQALPLEQRQIVFYSEGPSYWTYFELVVQSLTSQYNQNICYVSSSPDDPGLHQSDEKIYPFCIGEGSTRTIWFKGLNAGILVMTMPDLEQYHIKRSSYPVHYVYLFHSMVSTHMIYRKGAFDAYDTILCVGPQQIREIRETEQLYQLKEKKIVKHGYGRLDNILKTQKKNGQYLQASSPSHVLIAPSWGPNGLLETKGVELIEFLLQAGYRITIRPHPVTIKKWPKIIKNINRKFSTNSNYCLEADVSTNKSLFESDIMISDWSGVALEYAFGLLKPVLFVDVPRKVQNDEYERISEIPLEVKLRPEIGDIVHPSQLEMIPDKINNLLLNQNVLQEKIRKLRKENVFNLEKSGESAAKIIIEILAANVG